MELTDDHETIHDRCTQRATSALMTIRESFRANDVLIGLGTLTLESAIACKIR